jgi:thioredoxin/glutathione reductase (selenoprotein)
MGVTRLRATGRLHRMMNGSDAGGALGSAGAGDGGAAVPTSFDYDLIVIGGGSGGLACAREAANDPSKKVAVFDFVKPSPQGSTWDIGGTCVNVGCIPKKLMHTAALHGENHEDAQHFGWAGREKRHNWSTMVTNVRKHIHSLNEGAKSSLRKKDITYYNALGSFVNAHTIRATYGDGRVENVTARYVVVAVGGRPTPLPDCEGAEHAIDSDDIFMLPRAPGKTLCVGASYVALECAGFLTGLGYDTTVMVRSVLLRGFDQDVANRIAAFMQFSGTKFIRSATPTKIEKLADGRFRVHWANANKGSRDSSIPPGSDGSDVYDTVFAAVGRKPDTHGLNIAAAGLEVNRAGKFPGRGQGANSDRESTNVANVFALGDCLEGVPELTPVAIQAGQFLARRLFAGATQQMPYELVATTVFTPLEYGSVGVSEDSVREPDPSSSASSLPYTPALDQTYRGTRLKAGYVVHSKAFTPLEWTVVPREHRPRSACSVKVICQGKDQRIVGVHYLGPNAGEVVQGFSLAVRLGATAADLRDTVGIHPTNAEIMTLVVAAVSAGPDAEAEAEAEEKDEKQAGNTLPLAREVEFEASSSSSGSSGLSGGFKFDVGTSGDDDHSTGTVPMKFDFFGGGAGGDAEECAT